jgi:hypothetical protein
MSTTIKRIALVAVAALGLGVVSVAPSQASISSVTFTVADGTAKLAGATLTADTTTAAVISVAGLFDAASTDTITVQAVQKTVPTGASVTALLGNLETSTSTLSRIALGGSTTRFESATAATAVGTVVATNTGYAGGKFTLQLSPSSSTVKAGTYTYTIITKVLDGATVKSTSTLDVNIVVTASSLLSDATSVSLLSTIGTDPAAAITAGVTTDSVTVASKASAATAPVASIYVKQKNATSTASEKMTATISGPGSILKASSYNASQTTVGARAVTMDATDYLYVFADGTTGVATITITGNDSGLVLAKKTVTFFDTKPVSATAKALINYIAGGASNVAGTFVVSVKDASGNAITSLTSITGAATDSTTAVGGAVTCVNTYSASKGGYLCGVAGKSATKFGKVNYTFTATGTDTDATVVKATADVTFSSNVATKIVIAPSTSTANPGDVVTYTLTATDANGYPVADAAYNASGTLPLFASVVASGFATDKAPFAVTDTVTTVDGVATSKGTLNIAGTGKATWTLAGTKGALTDGTALAAALLGTDIATADVTISNPGVDAATDAANEAAQAASDATDAALAAADAADAATTKAQEAVDAVATLSAEVSKLITALKAQITTLTNLVIKIQKKVKA